MAVEGQQSQARIRRLLGAFVVWFTLGGIAGAQSVVTQPIAQFGFGDINSVTFSPDGSQILVGGTNAHLVSVATGKINRIFGTSGRPLSESVTAALFSPDGAQILTVADSGQTVKLWNVATGSAIRTEVRNHANAFGKKAAFSPDGTLVLSSHGKLWNCATGDLVRDFTSAYNFTVAYSPDGTRVLIGQTLWNVATGAQILSLSGNTVAINSAAFSPSGSHLLTGGNAGTVRLWDVSTGNLIRSFSGHSGFVLSVAFSSDGTLALTGGEDQTARIWNVATGNELHRLDGHIMAVNSVAFSPHGDAVVTSGSDNRVLLWDSTSGNLLRRFDPGVNYIFSSALSPDGKLALLNVPFSKIVKIWDTATSNEWSELSGHAEMVNEATYSADGSKILTASEDYTAKLWDAKTHGLLRTFTHSGTVYSAAISNDGTRVAGSSYAGLASIKVWNVSTGATVATLPSNTSGGGLVFSPDGTRLLAGGSDGTAKLWNIANGALIHSFGTVSGPEPIFFPVAYSPDGKSILIGGDRMDTGARLYDANTGIQIRAFPSQTDALQFSPDGSEILIGGVFESTLWETATGNLLRSFRGHCQAALSVSFSADGRRILTSSGDGTAILWDADGDVIIKNQADNWREYR